MKPAICLLSVIPMRREPSHRSEMVSQLLFGEYVTMGEEQSDFVFVRCEYDGYEGWVQATQLTCVDEKQVYKTNSYTSNFTTLVTKNTTLLYVPYASPVYKQAGYSFSIGNEKMDYLLQPQQTWEVEKNSVSLQLLEAIYQPYIHVPYLWGGKSVFGIDCSGFAQQVFKLLGVKLLRDAYMQAEQGFLVNGIAEARLGDLAFFCNEAGRVTHVGIVLEAGKIIHASGRVRIDAVDEKGIINSENGKQTHTMHSIRRIL